MWGPGWKWGGEVVRRCYVEGDWLKVLVCNCVFVYLWGGGVRSSEMLCRGRLVKGARRRRVVCGLMKLLLPVHLSTRYTRYTRALLSTEPHFCIAKARRRCLHTNFLSAHLAQWNIPSKCQIYNQRMGPTQLHTPHHQFQQGRCRRGGGGLIIMPQMILLLMLGISSNLVSIPPCLCPPCAPFVTPMSLTPLLCCSLCYPHVPWILSLTPLLCCPLLSSWPALICK